MRTLTSRGRFAGINAGRMSVAVGLGVAAVALSGCCGDGKREMEAMADKYYDQGYACCKEIVPLDPDDAVACFESLKDWRLETGNLIIQWYQACMADNEELARHLIEILRGMTSTLPGDGCPMTAELPDGRHWTVGVPLHREDVLSLDGRLVVLDGRFGRVEPPQAARAIRWAIREGGLRLEAGGRTIDARMSGSFTVGEADAAGDRSIVDATIDWSVGDRHVVLRLADDPAGSRWHLDGPHEALDLRMSVTCDPALGILLPPVMWLHLPLARDADGIRFAGGVRPATDVIPVAPGIADWNGDTHVDDEDWVAFLGSEPVAGVDPRDVTLDGEFDAQDVDRFLAAWRDRYGT